MEMKSIGAAAILWVACMVALGFVAHGMWHVFMVGWNLL